jgi:hypothetical protein
MTLNEILTLAVKKQDFNTCNGWGFGGGIGTEYTFANGVTLRKGTAYYRHIKSHAFVAVYKDGNRVIDEITLNKAKLLELTELITAK